MRNNEQGKVELIFTLNTEGNLKNINVGKRTNSPERLITAAKKTLERLSPFEKNTILLNENIFSIVIIYKLN